MATYRLNDIVPFMAVHPGEVLKDELSARNMTQARLSAESGVPKNVVSEIINGKRGINAEYALCFERALGIPASDFLNLQKQFELDSARIREKAFEDRRMDEIESKLNISLNVPELCYRLGIVATVTERVNKVLSAIGGYGLINERVITVGYFKKSEKCRVNERNLRTWIIIAQYRGEQATVSAKFSKEGAVEAARIIANEANLGVLTESRICEILSGAGIAYVVEPKLEGCPVDAYSVMLKEHPAIAVTHRHNNMQKLIFDILHELGHILLHMADKEYCGFISSSDYVSDESIEKEANAFAQDMLIPPATWKKILGINLTSATPNNICSQIGAAALKYGIDPRIAVARYKHDSREYRGRAYANTKII